MIIVLDILYLLLIMPTNLHSLQYPEKKKKNHDVFLTVTTSAKAGGAHQL